MSYSEAVRRVAARHTTLFGLMAFDLLPFSIEPESRDDAGNVVVVISWTYQQRTRYAHYWVDSAGNVTPADHNAAIIDTVAKYGPLAISQLTGL